MSPLTTQNKSIALIVGATFFLVLLDSSIIVTALPAMARDFGVATVDLSVGVSAYLLAVAAFVPVAGWLSDRFGPRKVFLFSIVVFALASALCGLAESLPQFIAARVLQGMGGALMTPVGRILVLNHTPKNALVGAMAMITWPAMTAPVLGPVLGGFITTYFSWQWNFYINLPLGALALVAAHLWIPRQDQLVRRPFDTVGFLLSAGGLICLLYGLESFAHSWLSPPQTVLLMALGTLLGWLAVRHLRGRENPILNLRPFAIPTFAMTNIWSGTYVRAGINAAPFLIPLFFQEVCELTPLQAGGYLLVYFVGNLGMKSITTITLRLFGFRSVLLVNGILSGALVILCGFIATDTSDLVIMPALFLAGGTRSLQYTALNTLTFVDIPPHQRSSAAPLSSMLMQVSMVLGIALSAVTLHGSQWFAGRDQLHQTDFQIAFTIMGALACVFSLGFLRLPRQAGAEVSGCDPQTSFGARVRQLRYGSRHHS